MAECNCRVRDAVADVAAIASREAWAYTNHELRSMIRDAWDAYRVGRVTDPQRTRALLLVLTLEVERMEGAWPSDA